MEVSAEIFDLIELVDWAVKASPSCKNVDCWEIYVLIVRLSSGVGWSTVWLALKYYLVSKSNVF